MSLFKKGKVIILKSKSFRLSYIFILRWLRWLYSRWRSTNDVECICSYVLLLIYVIIASHIVIYCMVKPALYKPSQNLSKRDTLLQSFFYQYKNILNLCKPNTCQKQTNYTFRNVSVNTGFTLLSNKKQAFNCKFFFLQHLSDQLLFSPRLE